MPSEEFIQETIRVWSQYYGYEISRSEALEIIAVLEDLSDFLSDQISGPEVA